MIEERILELLTPITREMGVDVLQVSLGGGDHQQLLRVVIDRSGGVPFEYLERITRALSLQLDAEDLVRDRYRMEVSSPGLDWPLTDEADFKRHVGETLQVCFKDGSRLEGENLGPCSGGVRVRDRQGDEHEIVADEVVKIMRVVAWKHVNKQKKKKKQSR